MLDLDPHEQRQEIDGVPHAAPVTFDDILPEDFRQIETILWFSRRGLLADSESNFAVLEHYAWDGEFL